MSQEIINLDRQIRDDVQWLNRKLRDWQMLLLDLNNARARGADDFPYIVRVREFLDRLEINYDIRHSQKDGKLTLIYFDYVANGNDPSAFEIDEQKGENRPK